jgi:leader peptidase (prepilin peptidase)/N-methyltransferase
VSLFWHHPLCGLVVFVVGCCLGSFFNVCIYRIPLGLSVVTPRSRCAACGVPLKAFQNFPLLGWLRHRGWCACGLTKIDFRYFFVELFTALLLTLLWFSFPPPLFGLYGLLLSGLLIASLIDIDHYIIPDRFSLGGIILGLIASALFPWLHQTNSAWAGFLAGLLGAAVGGGLLFAISWLGRLAFKKDAMGLGDVKLLAAMGAFLGWQAPFFIIAVSSMIGSVVGLLFLWKGPVWYGSRLPFGPFLSLAAALWIFGGADWWARYWAALSGFHS